MSCYSTELKDRTFEKRCENFSFGKNISKNFSDKYCQKKLLIQAATDSLKTFS